MSTYVVCIYWFLFCKLPTVKVTGYLLTIHSPFPIGLVPDSVVFEFQFILLIFYITFIGRACSPFCQYAIVITCLGICCNWFTTDGEFLYIREIYQLRKNASRRIGTAYLCCRFLLFHWKPRTRLSASLPQLCFCCYICLFLLKITPHPYQDQGPCLLFLNDY